MPICTRAAIHLTGKDENILAAVPIIHHVIDPARIFHSHGARHGAMRVGITAPGQAQTSIEKQPRPTSLRRICWDQSTVCLLRFACSRITPARLPGEQVAVTICFQHCHFIMSIMKPEIRFGCVSAISIMLAFAPTGCSKGKSTAGAGTGTTSLAVSKKLAAIKATGEPMTPEELNNWYAEPPASENAAGVYAQAFSALTTDDPKSATFLSKNQNALALLLQATERKSCRYPVDLRAGFATQLPHLANIKKCAALLQSEAVSQAGRNHTDAAAKAVLAGVRLSRSLEDEPILISHLVKNASLTIAVQGLEQALTRKAFTRDQLVSLQAALESAEVTAPFRQTLIGERCTAISSFQMAPEELAKVFSQIDGNAKTFAGLTAHMKSPVFQQDFEFALDYFSNMLAMAKMPFPQRLDADGGPKIETAIARQLMLSSMLLPALSTLPDREAEVAARVRVAQTALAVECYRLEHANALPGSLSELTPALLKAVPTDPFDGQPLRYKRLPGNGCVIYSVGKNRQDDQGASSRTDEKKSQPLDITFTIQR